MNGVGAEGETALLAATRQGHIAVVETLLRQPGIDVNKAGKKGDTALHVAAREGNLNIVRALLACPEIRVNQVAEDGMTLLHNAIGRGLDVLRELLSVRDLNINELFHGDSVLHISALNALEEDVEALLGYPGIDVNQVNIKGRTALHNAVDRMNSDASLVAILLRKAGIDVNKADHQGKTALHYAVNHWHVQNIKALVEKGGIDVNALDGEGNTPLHLAIRRAIFSDVRALEALLAHPEIDLDKPNRAGKSAWVLAIEKDGLSNILILSLLLHKVGVNVEGLSNGYAELLTYAAARRDMALTNFLLERNPRLYRDEALSRAAQAGHTEIVERLASNWQPSVYGGAKEVSRPDDDTASIPFCYVLNERKELLLDIDGTLRFIDIPELRNWYAEYASFFSRAAAEIFESGDMLEILKALKTRAKANPDGASGRLLSKLGISHQSSTGTLLLRSTNLKGAMVFPMGFQLNCLVSSILFVAV